MYIVIQYCENEGARDCEIEGERCVCIWCVRVKEKGSIKSVKCMSECDRIHHDPLITTRDQP